MKRCKIGRNIRLYEEEEAQPRQLRLRRKYRELAGSLGWDYQRPDGRPFRHAERCWKSQRRTQYQCSSGRPTYGRPPDKASKMLKALRVFAQADPLRL